MAANQISCISPLRSSLLLQPSVPGQTETLLLFTPGCYLGSFPDSGAVGWGAQLGVETPHFSGGNPQLLKYSSGSSAAAYGSPASSPASALHFLQVMLF